VKRVARKVGLGVVAALVLSACGLIAGLGGPSGECAPRPVEEVSVRPWFGPAAAAATSCAPIVRVAGLDYTPLGGRWLDEDALTLTEYGLITHASWPTGEPVAYALDGVPPEQFLVIATAPEDLSAEENGSYTVLARDAEALPSALCDYADPADSQYPADDCPLSPGRQYRAGMITACGLGHTMGPYGGVYWRVIDPPKPLPSSVARDIDYGTVELLRDGRLRYRGEGGADLTLAPTQRDADDAECRKYP